MQYCPPVEWNVLRTNSRDKLQLWRIHSTVTLSLNSPWGYTRLAISFFRFFFLFIYKNYTPKALNICYVWIIYCLNIRFCVLIKCVQVNKGIFDFLARVSAESGSVKFSFQNKLQLLNCSSVFSAPAVIFFEVARIWCLVYLISL